MPDIHMRKMSGNEKMLPDLRGYNIDNQLTSANKTGLSANFAYDGAGRLNQSIIAGVTTNLSYDGTELVAEYDSAATLLRRYVHGPGVDEPLVWYEGATTTNKTWLYADHQGSIVATANSAGTSTATLHLELRPLRRTQPNHRHQVSLHRPAVAWSTR